MIVRTCDWIAKAIEGKFIGSPVDRYRLIQGVTTDSRKVSEGSLFVPLKGEKFDGHQFLKQAIQAGIAASLWQEGVPLPEQVSIPLILVKDSLTALQRLASRYRRELDFPIIAVTGSNGKTTTKDLIASVLSVKYQVSKTEGNLNNHIGVPLTLLSMSEKTEIGIVEMGMNHKGEIAQLSKIARPDGAVVTNIGEAHIGFFSSRDEIAEAKLEIQEGIRGNGFLMINGDEPLLREKTEMSNYELVKIGFDPKENDQYPVEIEMQGIKGIQFSTKEKRTRFQIPILGRHNVLNALYAIEVGRFFELTDEEIQQGLAAATISAMRLQIQRANNGMLIINDAYNANPTSMKAALDLLEEFEHAEKWVLLGDVFDLGEKEEKYHREIGAYAVTKKIDRVYTIGDRGKWIADGAIAAKPQCQIQHFQSHDEASEHLAREGNQGVTILVKASRAMHLDQVVQKLI